MTGVEERVPELEPALPPGESRRRSPRLVCGIPLTVSLGSRSLPARSAVINIHGALILCLEAIPEGAFITLFNEKTGGRVEAFVVWTGVETVSLASPSLSQFKMGVEFRRPAADFWGLDYKP